MFEKIKNYQRHPFIRQLHDVRALGLLAFGILALMVTWSGVKALQTNYELQKQISALQQENQVQELENNNLKLKNQYLNTDQFLELAARRQFGKAAPGEMLLLVPKAVALKHTVEAPSLEQQGEDDVVSKPAYQRNFESWINFFLHRQTFGD